MGPWEKALSDLATSAAYTGHGGYPTAARRWEEASAAFNSTAASTGFEGHVADAATVALRSAASRATTLARAADSVPTLLHEADAIRGRAQNALSSLPSSVVPPLLLSPAVSLGLGPDVTRAFAARREWVAKAYREDEGVRADVDDEILLAQRAADELAGSGGSSFSFTGEPSLTGRYPTTENWQKAIGAHQQWASGEVVVKDGVATMGSVSRTVTWTLGDPGSVSVSDAPAEGR